jgi:hypothetical protein
MVGGVTDRPPIPLVELVRHYREFKSRRVDGVLVPGPYRSHKARVQLAEAYLENPTALTAKFFGSVDGFSSYANTAESLIGAKRTDPAEVAAVDEITTGPKAAAYLARTLPNRKLTIPGLGAYSYVDREIVPARTTAGKLAAMANRFDDEEVSRSTRAMKADLLLRSLPDGRPTIGEVKVSSVKGDDADPFYGLVQALALASQLAGTQQRLRLRRHYQAAEFADEGPLDVLVLLVLIAERPGKRTYRRQLIELTNALCTHLDQGPLRPHVERIALVTVTPCDGGLQFAV